MPTEAPLNIARLLRQQVESWQAAGVSHLAFAPSPGADPQLSLPTSAAAPQSVATQASMDASVAVSPAPRNPDSMKSPSAARPAPSKTLFAAPDQTTVAPPTAAPAPSLLTREERVQRLTVLTETVRGCTRCTELATTRTNTVFGVGNPQARILFIGEAPGADEDAQGEPFVGKAGQLLNQIIGACRLKREEIYICNVLKCRPPGNRTPLPDECANCREHLDGQLATIDPEYIVCWGAVAAQNLLSTEVAIGKLRKRFHQHGRAKVLCTYHPSYLLRNPAAKKDVWDDMKLLFADMGVDLSQK
jgi:DNA polymerase